MSTDERGPVPVTGSTGSALDVERDSDVPISTQIFWQLAYQIDSGRLLPGARLPPVRELGAALRVNPNTIRAVYRRLADAGYVTSRHGAGTHVAERPPQRRGTEALAGIVAEMLRRAAHAGFTADEVAAATFAAATERKRPGPARPRPLRRVHERRCRLRRRAAGRRVPGHDRGRGRAPRRPARAARPVPLRPRGDDDVPRRRGPGRSSPAASRSWRCSSGPATSSSSTRSPGCRPARGSGSSAPRERGADNIRETLALAGHDAASRSCPRSSASRTTSSWSTGPPTSSSCRARRSRPGLDGAFSRPERIRPWTYDFDPSGLELLRRAIEHVAATRRADGPGLAAEPPSEVPAT